MINHEGVWLYLPASHHLLWPTLASFGLVLVCVFEQLEPVADLRLVKAIRVVGWLGRACNRLLAGSL